MSQDVKTSRHPTTYSVITRSQKDRPYFTACNDSVARLLADDRLETNLRRIEWITVDDDTYRLNDAVLSAQHEWLLFMGSADLIEPYATRVLDHYIRKFPRCRYISSEFINVDENGKELERNSRDIDASFLYERGMIAGHVTAIRRDLFDEIGLFDPSVVGCREYQFALRAAAHEPLLFIPECLYSHRLHTSAMDGAARDTKSTQVVRQRFLEQFIDANWPAPAPPPAPRPLARSGGVRGICILRTQGHRLEMLAEALESVWSQQISMTPCIVVHGDVLTLATVEACVEPLGRPLVVLHAGAAGLLRGYPLNVGLQYVAEHTDAYDFVSFLDDDDIYLPFFAERLCEALELTGADLAYALTDARTTEGELSAAHAPMPTACLVSFNFIPNNAYVLRTETLIRSRARFREDVDYLEDWDFLLSLLEAGARFRCLEDTLAEFRLTGDGNVEVRRDSAHFHHCLVEVRKHGQRVARQLGYGAYYRDLVERNFARLEPPDHATTSARLFEVQRVFSLAEQLDNAA